MIDKTEMHRRRKESKGGRAWWACIVD